MLVDAAAWGGSRVSSATAMAPARISQHPRVSQYLKSYDAAGDVCQALTNGGANRLYDELPAFLPHLDPAEVRATYIPDRILGRAWRILLATSSTVS